MENIKEKLSRIGRMFEERNELEIKIDKLDTFMNTSEFKSLSYKYKDLLYKQLDVMYSYHNILTDRLMYDIEQIK